MTNCKHDNKKKGIAIKNDDFTKDLGFGYTYVSEGAGSPRIVSCVKCLDCGKSWKIK